MVDYAPSAAAQRATLDAIRAAHDARAFALVGDMAAKLYHAEGGGDHQRALLPGSLADGRDIRLRAERGSCSYVL